MEEALRARLQAAAAIAAIVAGRVDWGARVQGSPLSAVTLNRAGGNKHYTYKGPSALQNVRVQADSWAKTAGDAILLARALIAELELPAIVGDIKFSASFVLDDDDPEPMNDGGNKLVHRVRTDFAIWHQPA